MSFVRQFQPIESHMKSSGDFSDTTDDAITPPHRVLKAYQYRSMDRCFIAICIFIKPSQTNGPIFGWFNANVYGNETALEAVMPF